MTQPLISCIMPCNRPENLIRAIDIFRAQDYSNKQLIIVQSVGNQRFDVGVDWLKERNIKSLTMPDNETIGAKRNFGAWTGHGEVVAHFDDDDYYAPDYLTRAYNHLITSGADITGLSSAYFYRKEPEQAWKYEYKGGQPYVLGSGMMYRKEVWERKPFPDISEGEDTIFQSDNGRVSAHGYIDGFVAMIHGNNTASHKQLQHMTPVDPSIPRSILSKHALPLA